MAKSIRFNLKPGDSEIETVREKGSDFLKAHGFSDDTVQTQMTIIHQLICSGRKFGNVMASKNEMTVLLLIENNAIIVEVSKPVNESSYSQLDELDKTIQSIRRWGYQDPFEPHTIKYREICENSQNFETEGFELAKIAYEEGAVLDFYVSEDSILNLSAVRNLDGNLNG
ncbi:MAG: hypothetical protein WBM69_10880 [Desulfobacterales bacterium]